MAWWYRLVNNKPIKAMKTYLSILFFYIINYYASGQYYPNRGSLFEARIKTTDGRINRVNLFALTDSAIFVTNKSLNPADIYTYNYETNLKIPVKNIKQIKFRIKGATKEGFISGALFGVIIPLCFTLELSELEDEIQWDKYIFVSLSFAAASTLIGGALGSKHAYYPIKCDHETYQDLRRELEYYAIMNNYFYDK